MRGEFAGGPSVFLCPFFSVLRASFGAGAQIVSLAEGRWWTRLQQFGPGEVSWSLRGGKSSGLSFFGKDKGSTAQLRAIKWVYPVPRPTHDRAPLRDLFGGDHLISEVEKRAAS